MSHNPETKDFKNMVFNSFAKQGMMTHLGAQISDVRPGSVEIRLAYKTELLQQHGLFHGGATTAILDSAGGYAALSLFRPGDEVLTVEYKINFIAPAIGDELVARGEVIKVGKSLSITRGNAYVIKDGNVTLCAVMQQTMMRILNNTSSLSKKE